MDEIQLVLKLLFCFSSVVNLSLTQIGPQESLIITVSQLHILINLQASYVYSVQSWSVQIKSFDYP